MKLNVNLFSTTIKTSKRITLLNCDITNVDKHEIVLIFLPKSKPWSIFEENLILRFLPEFKFSTAVRPVISTTLAAPQREL
jgi:hypothetical protein